ncbi:hypothetical protein HBI56_140070 [Parastagonospora nodorum]|nr:hypothetical protein HBH54_095760 [Parastagonospora nodorum]KAH4019084.1 hypothetical protein HBI13_130250 [Parastagonospora nodorum]KAH4028573.1 hypothetical protein HBI09_138930 [Parastagonospora nodorum]KAH4070637.1 hypothetical protein HBH50_086480 [Parastagonospora nodorum]KAH4105067.1 hypothetical protein HBH46_090420 [Parastagonospora nodorum]
MSLLVRHLPKSAYPLARSQSSPRYSPKPQPPPDSQYLAHPQHEPSRLLIHLGSHCHLPSDQSPFLLTDGTQASSCALRVAPQGSHPYHNGRQYLPCHLAQFRSASIDHIAARSWGR